MKILSCPQQSLISGGEYIVRETYEIETPSNIFGDEIITFEGKELLIPGKNSTGHGNDIYLLFGFALPVTTYVAARCLYLYLNA